MSLRRLSLALPRAQALALAAGLSAEPWPLALFEGADGRWRLEVLVGDAAAASEIGARIALLAAAAGFAPPALAEEAVPELDWLAVTRQAFPPRRIGRYRLRASHHAAKAGGHDIVIDVGPAFGSGEHPSTEGCLVALDGLARGAAPRRVLDMGTGSGVLAVAAAKTWPGARVVAVDIDPMAAANAAAHVRANRLGARVAVHRAAGFRHPALGGCFDLVLANILARPLIAMAGPMATALAPAGTVVLAGLLVRHERAVLAAYRARGLALARRILRDGWVTLVLRRPRRGRRGPARRESER